MKNEKWPAEPEDKFCKGLEKKMKKTQRQESIEKEATLGSTIGR